MIRYASVCSGIGAPECGWSQLGWQCKFAAEIEAFPSAVYARHYPKVPNYGDITKFKEWPQHAIDVLVGGTPCQSFSVAGLRKGMADPRGNLALTLLAIVGKYAPAWVVWENVPGVLSIDEGRAFGSFLGGLAELGYGFAYRVLDAQYFGVAQRRRRVFVVGHAGGQWQRAAAVLFERESMCGNPAPRRETGQRIAGRVAGCSNGGGPNGPGRTADDADSLIAKAVRTPTGGIDREDMHTLIAHRLSADGFDASEDGTGRGTPLIAQTINGTMGRSRGAAQSDYPLVPEVAWALQERDAKGVDSDTKEGHLIAFNCKDHGADASELAPTLRACPHDKSHANSGAPPAIAFTERTRADGRNFEASEEIAFALTNPGSGGRTHSRQVAQGYAVRRLTPTECERLQGFPDGYTAIQYRGKPACDGPRYKALGNSMAVPVLKWIGERIELVHAL